MKKYYLFILTVFFISLIFAIQIVNFDNQTSSINILFSGNQNITRSITLNTNATVSSATLNVTGLYSENFSYIAYRSYPFSGSYNFSARNFTQFNVTGYQSSDLYFDACSFSCNYWEFGQVYPNSTANGWTTPSDTVPNCTNASYSRVAVTNWNANQYICVNDSTNVLRILKFNIDNSPAVGSSINFSWDNYSTYSNSFISNPYITINNNITSGICYQESANVSNQDGTDGTCGLIYTGSYSTDGLSDYRNFTDGNWNTFFDPVPNVTYLYINYTKPVSAVSSVLDTRYYDNDDGLNHSINTTIPSSCFNYDSTKVILRFYFGTDFNNFQLQCQNSSGFKTIINYGTQGAVFYDEAMTWNTTSISKIFNYSGVFSSSVLTSNFATSLNSLLNNGKCDCISCSLTNTNCTINFTIHSDTSGIMNINNLNIIWTEPVNPSMTIINPNGTYNSSSFPLQILISDNWQLTNTCIYWIMNGPNLVQSNTTWDCSNISVGLTANGVYTINVCDTDTSSNNNCSSKDFTMNIPTGPGGGGGGGGSDINPPVSTTIGVLIPNSGNWTMSTSGLTNYYDLKMTASSSRNEPILFQNTGVTSRPITLTCEDENGSLCQYVTFEKQFDLPVLRDIKTSKDIEITIPNNIPDGLYVFNIYASDDLGNKQVVTFLVSIGNFGIITNAIVKAGSSLSINGINVPYLVVAVFVGFIFFIIFYFLLRKKSYGASVSFLIGIISAVLAIIII